MMLPKIMLLAMLTAVLALPATAQEWTTPIIEGYGRIKYYKDTDLQPQKDMQYKVAFDLKSDKKKEGVNAGLWKMARFLNLLGAAGVPAENISLVDRKSTRLNSSHVSISYAVFCLKKKKK